MSEKQPNPGSPEAVALGCKCPVMDNGHGKGIHDWTGQGRELFWINGDCPLHGDKKEEKE